MTDHKQRREERRRLWGRAQGRPLSAHQTKLVQQLYPKIAVPLGTTQNVFAGLELYSSCSLEIGFGGAEHLLHRARQYPNHGFIGAEPFLNGVAKALAGIAKDDIKNIRLHHGDVRPVLDVLPKDSLAQIYILYPDPWPKPRHFKRRLIKKEFIESLHRVLKPGGTLYFASDIPSYVDWTLSRMLAHTGFVWSGEHAKHWLTPFPGWPGTRYEAKALREGRTPHYFSFEKLK